jgi:CheY-like chemotaxis protein
MLEVHDLIVDSAESAEDAIDYLGDNRPDIIFMDHEMPGMDGLEAVSTIKNNPETASIPIMMYTAQEGEVYVGQARALGAVGVLPKHIEPVEVSKVLESLQIIGGDSGKRRRVDDDAVMVASASGAYPSLQNLDRDIRVLIQELFDQQRTILQRDLFDSQQIIANRVAKEIRPPEKAEEVVEAPTPKRESTGLLRLIAAGFAAIALFFGFAYWQKSSSLDQALQESTSLQQLLSDQSAIERQDMLQIQSQLNDHQLNLASAQKVALSSVTWAANQASNYGFYDLPLDDYRLSVISELTDYLIALDFRGVVRIETHVGNFCMTVSGPDGYALSAEELPAIQCDQIGFSPDEAYQFGLRQSVAFATFVSLAEERSGGRIRYEITSFGNSRPDLEYPAAANVMASTWNDIAANNNRVEVSIYSDRR